MLSTVCAQLWRFHPLVLTVARRKSSKWSSHRSRLLEITAGECGDDLPPPLSFFPLPSFPSFFFRLFPLSFLSLLPFRRSVFCHVNQAPLLRCVDPAWIHFPWIDFRQTFHEHVSRWWLATMVSYSRNLSIKGSNFPKTPLFLFLGYPVCVQATGQGNVLRRLHSFHPPVDIPQIYLS